MRSRRITSAILLGALPAVLVGCAALGPRTASDTPHGATVARDQLAAKARLGSDELIAELVPATPPGCSAAVAVEGVVLLGGRGWARRPRRRDAAVTTATRFDIASVSKQFTATAILMLQRDGLLSLADAVGNYVDDLPSWAETVTLDQLIHHTSHIPDFWVELDNADIGFTDPADQADTLAAISRETELEEGRGFAVLELELRAPRRGGGTRERAAATPVPRRAGLRPDGSRDGGGARPARTRPRALLQRRPQPAATRVDGVRAHRDHHDPVELARWGDAYRTNEIVQDDFAVGAVDESAGELYAAGIDIEADGDLNHTGRWGGYISSSPSRRTG